MLARAAMPTIEIPAAAIPRVRGAGERRRRREYRARKRAQKRAAQDVCEIVTHAACGFGADHQIRAVLSNVNGALLHISSDCTRRPPSDAERTVIQALSDGKFVCCADVVKVAAEHAASAACGFYVGAALKSQTPLPAGTNHYITAKALRPLRDLLASAQHRQSTPRWDPATFRGEVTEAALASLCIDRRTGQPVGKALGLKFHVGIMTPDTRPYSDIPPPKSFLLVSVSMLAPARGYGGRIAKLTAGGRFVLLTAKIKQFAADYRHHPLSSWETAYCAPCAEKLAKPCSFTPHSKTAKHKDAVERAVLAGLEVIASNLTRSHLTQAAQAGKL